MPTSTPSPLEHRHAEPPTVLRIDRFTCPLAHWPAFAERLAFIDGHLQSQAHCKMSRVATSERDGQVYVITIAEWKNREALLAAKQEMAAIYAENGFDPAAFLAQHAIEGEFATFETMVV